MPPPEHGPPPSADDAPPTLRLVTPVAASLHDDRPGWAPDYAACRIDAAWLERLRRLRALACREGIEQMEVPAVAHSVRWGAPPGGRIEASYLVVGQGWFRWRGWFDNLTRYVETDDLYCDPLEAAIELALASQRLGARTGSVALAQALAHPVGALSDREVGTSLLASGDLYAGAPSECDWVAQRLLDDDRRASAQPLRA